MPVPPLGLFHAGSPSHCAPPATGPATHPKLVSLLDTPGDTFQYLWYRTPGETYGSMLIPGVGSGTLKPMAPCAVVVCCWSVSVPEVTLGMYAPPSCRFTANGSRLPPIRRASTVPPYDSTRSVKLPGFQDATPAVSTTEPDPSATRPP